MEAPKHPPVDKEHARLVTLGNTQTYIYKHGYVSEICHGVKEHNPEAIKEMADFLAKQIHSDCFLVPAPQHTGKAEYTLEICKLIKEQVPYDVVILDIMGCTPRETLWAIKKAWQEANGTTDLSKQKFSSGMYLVDAIDNLEGPIYFVDNVVSTGTTLRDAEELIPNIKPLVFAVSERYVFRPRGSSGE